MTIPHSLFSPQPSLKELSHQQERLISCQEEIVKVVEQLGEQQARLIHTQGLSIENQADLTQSMRDLMTSQVELTQVLKSMGEQLASHKAALERLDCIMDYLIRRDGERTPNSESE